MYPFPTPKRKHRQQNSPRSPGVYEGSDVMVLGLAVGKVDKIVPKGTYVEVHMTIDGGVKIPKEAIAAIISPSIVTDRHIEITPPYTGGDTLDQLNAFLAHTSTMFGQHADELSTPLTGLTNVTNQLRANSGAMVEIVDIVPLLMQNIDGVIDKERRFARMHALIGTGLSGEIVSVFCERIQMKSDGCRTGNMQDFGPDYGLTAALLGLTK
ncbi:MCE family protein [Nocardia cyriacigeorgica]|uniref:MCE family protein n=1 Tax=Nocardia cyriacigeorgica TaxID=135487 RepID=A0A6P1CZ57_9NOCA|nr:MCE family protein [Nocardia cyriacigeorgica]NEW43307.1 MCE family protein [Nocardia cyriacigeorgica]NEW48899.1 MCE family protein [Nocardia cyriacigeorgica]NEW56097.1 MCE family protein [Nocardia cyriacigeorgica]